MMANTNHLSALEVGLSNERARLAAAKTESERQARSVWVKQYEKEINDEKKFLGIYENLLEMTDDELLNELMEY